ncbi:hypothetical protein NO219_04040, partial [Gluconacetobacter entanii]|nr:hypothetical protein [Gluconacetobacter entanii]
NANQDFLGHSYLSNDVNNDVVNDGKLPVTILNHKAASNGRLRLTCRQAKGGGPCPPPLPHHAGV